MKGDPEIQDAVDLLRSPMARRDPVRVAVGMITLGVAQLAHIDGEATVSLLQGYIDQVRDGRPPEAESPLPEPTHPAGSA